MYQVVLALQPPQGEKTAVFDRATTGTVTQIRIRTSDEKPSRLWRAGSGFRCFLSPIRDFSSLFLPVNANREVGIFCDCRSLADEEKMMTTDSVVKQVDLVLAVGGLCEPS